MVVWIFPAIKQYKNKYFFFFLILALSSFFIIATRFIFNTNSNLPVIFIGCLIIISLVRKDKIKHVLFWIVPFYIIVFIIALYLNNRFFELYVSLFLMLAVFYIIVTDFFNFSIVHQEINIFLSTLMFYMALTIFKKLNVLVTVYEGMFFYFITSAFQLLIGVFFSLYSFDNTKLNIKITSKKNSL